VTGRAAQDLRADAAGLRRQDGRRGWWLGRSLAGCIPGHDDATVAVERHAASIDCTLAPTITSTLSTTSSFRQQGSGSLLVPALAFFEQGLHHYDLRIMGGRSLQPRVTLSAPRPGAPCALGGTQVRAGCGLGRLEEGIGPAQQVCAPEPTSPRVAAQG
jgi:hypothetical protein